MTGRGLSVASFALVLFCAGAADARTITDMLGRTIVLPDRPLRVVSLAPSLTETAFALGRGDWLVGVTDQCDYPVEARRKPRVGGMGAPDLERVVAARPDLVLLTAEANSREVVSQLERVGITAFAVRPSTFPDVLRATRVLATALGAEGAGDEAVRRIRERVDALRRRIDGRARPRTLFLIWTDPMIAAGRGTFLDDLIGMAGGINVAPAGLPYPRLGWEAMLRAGPEVILVASHRLGARTEFDASLADAWRSWQAVPAIRTGRILSIPGDPVLRPGPRVAEGLDELARAIHPDSSEPRP
jgi:iron complex transport system substrate-binding protein